MLGQLASRLRARLAPRSASECRTCRSLRKENEALRDEVKRLEQQVQTLRCQLDDARRQGKRQAAPFSKGPPKANPKRPGRKAGADYGKKARRPIPEHVDEILDAPLPGCCPYCGGQVKESHVAAQYQEEIPPVRVFVRCFNVHVGHCVRCNKRLQGRHALQTSDALGAAAVQLGPHALGLAAELNKGLGVAFNKVCVVFKTAFSLSVTPGGLCLALHRVAGVLTPTYQALVGSVRQAPVVAADETGWKVAGQLQWLWVFVTPTVTVYAILDGRGFGEASSILGAEFKGKLLRDGWAPYRQFLDAVHQSCFSHLIRRCVHRLDIAQRGAARFPRAVLRILLDALALRDHWREQPPSPHGRAVHVGRRAAQMDRLLGWNPTDPDNRRLVKHLRNERDALFTFLEHPDVEATNWWAEQAIRPAVVTRKVWGGNRTERGARTQQTIATVLRTCRQQSVSSLRVLEVLLRSPVPLLAHLPSLRSGP